MKLDATLPYIIAFAARATDDVFPVLNVIPATGLIYPLTRNRLASAAGFTLPRF